MREFCLESGQRAEQVKVQQKQNHLEAPYLTIHLRAGVDDRINRVRVRTVLARNDVRTNHPHIRMRLEILLAQLHEIIAGNGGIVVHRDDEIAMQAIPRIFIPGIIAAGEPFIHCVMQQCHGGISTILALQLLVATIGRVIVHHHDDSLRAMRFDGFDATCRGISRKIMQHHESEFCSSHESPSAVSALGTQGTYQKRTQRSISHHRVFESNCRAQCGNINLIQSWPQCLCTSPSRLLDGLGVGEHDDRLQFLEIQVHLLLVPSPKQRRIAIEMVLTHESGTLVNGRMV